MKPYNKDTPCVKCGEIGATSIFRHPMFDVPADIKRKCCNCGYEWYEFPLDACKSAEER